MENFSKRHIRVTGIVLLVVFAAIGLAWAIVWHAVNSVETVATISDIAGADVEIVYINSDAIAKSESMNVYLSEHKRHSWMPKVAGRRTLVFRYDPHGIYDQPLPSIMSPAANQLVISIPQASSVDVQRERWNGVSIRYEIGHIDYPQTR